MKKFLGLAACAVMLLAGCDMEGAPTSTTAPAAQNPVMPAPNTQQARVTDTSTRTSTTVDGNTTRTETTTTSVSVDAGGLLGALVGSGGASTPAANTTADYAGTWRVNSPDNRECRLSLRQAATSAAPAMVQNQGCFGDLLGVSRWSLRGNDLVLADGFGNVKATLRATARNRLEGNNVTMWR